MSLWRGADEQRVSPNNTPGVLRREGGVLKVGNGWQNKRWHAGDGGGSVRPTMQQMLAMRFSEKSELKNKAEVPTHVADRVR